MRSIRHRDKLDQIPALWRDGPSGRHVAISQTVQSLQLSLCRVRRPVHAVRHMKNAALAITCVMNGLPFSSRIGIAFAAQARAPHTRTFD